MGTVTNSIGSAGGRDYSTIALWEAALPANTVTAGNSYIGQCYNDSEFLVAGNVVTISGITTDSSHTIALTTGPGQSFRDNASVQTNGLRYNVANGVGLRCTSNTAAAAVVNNNDVTLSNLQIQQDGSGNYGSAPCASFQASSGYGTGADGPFAADCIFSVNNAGYHGNMFEAAGFGSIVNCLFVFGAGNYAGSIFTFAKVNGKVVNCTLVVPSDRGPSAGTQWGFSGTSNTYHGTIKIENCAVFGTKSGFADGGTNPTGSNNGTDASSISFGSANQTSLTYSSQFPNTTFASGDFKLKAGSSLLNTGATDTTDVPSATDIVGTSRPQGSAWDIGCWELVVVAVAVTLSLPRRMFLKR